LSIFFTKTKSIARVMELLCNTIGLGTAIEVGDGKSYRGSSSCVAFQLGNVLSIFGNGYWTASPGHPILRWSSCEISAL